MQVATRDRLTKEERARWTGAALALVELRYPAKAIAGDSVPESGRLLPHALAVLSHSSCDEVYPALAARVLRRTAIYMSARGLHTRAKEQLEHALSLFERAQELDRSQIGGAHWELGMVLYAIGEGAAACESLRKGASLLEGEKGFAGKTIFPQCLVSLAWVQRTLGDFEGTVATARRCIQHVVAVAGAGHPLVAMSLAPMARAQWSLNQISEARSSAAQARAILEAVPNPLPIVCGTWYALAQVYMDLGLLDAAFACATRGHAVGEPAYGIDHPLVCLNVRILGGVHLRRGDLPAARSALQAALESGERACRHLHEDIAIARTELACAANQAKDSDSALSLVRHALDGLHNLCGDPARFEGETRATLARVLRDRGAWQESIEQAAAALRAISGRYGDAHPLRVPALDALGMALRDGGRDEESSAAFAEAASLARAAALPGQGERTDAAAGEGLQPA